MKINKNAFVLGFIVFLIGAASFLWKQTEPKGKVYPSKEAMCIEFAQSYLRTIPRVESEFNDQKWEMAVDVETELYNMCLLELNHEALSTYKASALEKYRN